MNFTDLQNRIKKLLKEKNAILLVHYYQRGEIQDIADILGDSLALSIEAAKTDADIIVFAGVRFMAESAAILSPDKTVLLPREESGCPLADMITVPQLGKAREENPDASVVAYVNSSAEVKAHSDICCTSANAVRVVNSITDAKRVLMIPDGNLARYTSLHTDREIIPWKGYCPVHHFVTTEEVQSVKDRYPRAKFAAHPECRPEVLEMADFVGSTGGIIRFARETDAGKIIVGTELGIIHQLEKENPDKTFIPVSDKLICQDMKYITLEDIYDALVEMKHVVTVPDRIRIAANRALTRMLEVS
ncbi:MAG: quinolinate synthase NadA [Syntrophobacterales bacterium]|nr:quinolinate synthase NadA [Syntrophobacterales bacterium]